jgi:ATP-dependent RNA helicase RhlE
MASHTPRLSGTVKWYDQKRGFGFVTPDEGSEDVFVHHSALKRSIQNRLNTGDRIAYGVEYRKKGPSATDIVWLDESQSSPADESRRFADLDLIPDLLRAVHDAGYVEPTSIQAQAIPHALTGRDVLGTAQTGTGKTAAFALPLLQRLSAPPGDRHHSNGKRKKWVKRPVRALALTPTRELAVQIGDSFNTYGRYSGLTNTVIYGGVGQGSQVQALQRGVDILTATPGRLLDLIGQGYVHLEQVEVLVLDEADRMLDMGFIRDVQRIIKLVPKSRQTLLFSATMPREIVELADRILHNPIEVSVTPKQPTVEAIEQSVFFVPQAKKQALLEHVLGDSKVTRALVFTRTKHSANRVARRLQKAGVQAEPIHGNKSQAARQKALANFRNGKTRVLVATDVVARGIDVEHISHVIQFDLPNEPETYIHRIGRTGRAGAIGIALAFCSDKERPYLKDIEKLIRMRVPIIRDHP